MLRWFLLSDFRRPENPGRGPGTEPVAGTLAMAACWRRPPVSAPGFWVKLLSNLGGASLLQNWFLSTAGGRTKGLPTVAVTLLEAEVTLLQPMSQVRSLRPAELAAWPRAQGPGPGSRDRFHGSSGRSSFLPSFSCPCLPGSCLPTFALRLGHSSKDLENESGGQRRAVGRTQLASGQWLRPTPSVPPFRARGQLLQCPWIPP